MTPGEWFYFFIGVLVGINILLAVLAYQSVMGVAHAKARND